MEQDDDQLEVDVIKLRKEGREEGREEGEREGVREREEGILTCCCQ